MASPLEDLKELHKMVCDAFLTYAISHQVEPVTDHDIQQIIFTRAFPIKSFDKATIAAHETDDMNPYHPDNEKRLEVEWVAGTDLTVYSPEMNDTYSALDRVLASEDSRGLILTPSQSLAFFVKKEAYPNSSSSPMAGNMYAPPPGPPPTSTWDTTSNDRLFKVAPELHLDRYVWQNRHRIVELRQKHDALKKQLYTLKRRQASLATHAKTGRSILGKEEDGKTLKGLLSTVQDRLEQLAEGVPNEDRRNAQIRLAKKLEQIVQAIKDEAECELSIYLSRSIRRAC
jgi:hypothetical protein